MNRKRAKNDSTSKRSSFSRARTLSFAGLVAAILFAGCSDGNGNNGNEEESASWRSFLLAEDEIPEELHLCEPDWPEEASPQIFVNPGPKNNVDENGDSQEYDGVYQQWLTPEASGCSTGPSGHAFFIELTIPEDHQEYEMWRDHYWNSQQYEEIRCNEGLNLLWWGDEAAYDVRSTPTHGVGEETWNYEDAEVHYDQVKTVMRDKYPSWERAPC